MEHPVDVVLGTCLIVLNLTAFFTYGWDKCRAKKGQWRVPEHTLLALAFAGGGVGALLDASVSSQDPQNQVSLRRSGGCVAVAAVAGGIGNSNGNVAVLMAIFLKRFIKS